MLVECNPNIRISITLFFFNFNDSPILVHFYILFRIQNYQTVSTEQLANPNPKQKTEGNEDGETYFGMFGWSAV